jgi:hypothetical protein
MTGPSNVSDAPGDSGHVIGASRLVSRMMNSSPPTRDGVAVADEGGSQPDGAEQLIAAGVAERVVDQLEAVDIGNITETPARAAGARGPR